jgi:prepilin-type N-terminal cleavage/methylation domain-containing protein
MTRRSRAGFTLLEVVLAMTALALISAICYGAFHVGIRAVVAGEKAVKTAQRLRVASDVFTRQVRSAARFQNKSHGNFGDEIYFMGRPTSMSFVTAAAQLSGGGLAKVTYRIEDDPEQPGTQRVMLEEVPFFSAYTVDRARGEAGLARSALLLGRVEGASFMYFDEDDGWSGSWDTSPDASNPHENLPQAVRLMIEHLPGIDTPWGQETPLAIASYYNEENRDADVSLSLDNDELDLDEEDDADE